MPQTTTATKTQAPPVRPPKPGYEVHVLFREPVYPDGVYDRTDEDDDNPPE
jgi:hypothetical protein